MFRINYRSSFISDEQKLLGVKKMIKEYSNEDLLDLMIEFLANGCSFYYLLAKKEVFNRMSSNIKKSCYT